MSDNEHAVPGMGTPPNSPVPSSNLAGPSGLGTPPSSPVAQSTNPAGPAGPAGPVGPVGPAGQQPAATSVSLAPASMQAPVASTGQQPGTSMSIALPDMQVPVRPRIGPAQHHDELSTPSPLTLTSRLPSISQNSASVHTQPMAGTQVASGSVGESHRAGHDERAARVQRITQPPPLIWVPPPTSPPPGLSIQTTHDLGQQSAVRPAELSYFQGSPPGTTTSAPTQYPWVQQSDARPAIPGLTYFQGSPPGTTTFASTQPPYASGSAHVTAFGAPFVTQGLPRHAYVQPPAESSVPPWQTSGNNPVGSVTFAGMAQPNAYQYPPPPGVDLIASSTGGLPTAGTEQPVPRQFSVTPPWHRENDAVFLFP
ncbi:unnamed protein product [Penicillium nalgiovense]|uniref:Uncharacterized protein n=1 Tax=Penicillium nalgiovense TaxID=60175 RepID=A0A9W4MND5_PENNA|nr:unnamed protein product [Penicillium nalgiovense]CAG7943973.1 unnamed protein product [Penicillium nalgiovense]CAG7952214.1 unnamed protein product [Penicillium nalgiovense]CAG7953325.1 unnamed protein product [Penicillium nalgiovense]CAG7954399.1 unnamed protein product [Penicillium nalgiovense]